MYEVYVNNELEADFGTREEAEYFAQFQGELVSIKEYQVDEEGIYQFIK